MNSTSTKHYIIASVCIILILILGYIMPFMLGNNIPGNDIAWEQYLIVLILLLPACILLYKKPTSLWIYSYPVLIIAAFTMALIGGDALGAGLILLFITIPAGLIYTLLVATNIIK